ncbi:DNA helicase [Bacteroidia bacterium]|nr:DNA helicase [Bacteroidia bacterium]
MNKYKDEPRLIFRDTIQKNLIGPGSDVFLSDDDEEIISDFPLSRYFSGILFPEREKVDSIGLNDDINSRAESIDGEDSIIDFGSDETNEDDAQPRKDTKEHETEYSEVNQYYPTNFGLTFCVPKGTNSIDIIFSYAKYKQITPVDAKIEVKENIFKAFIDNPYNPIKDYFLYENGFMFFDKKVFEKGNLSVYSLKEKFQNENLSELLYSDVYNKVELLLGRLWKRIKQEPISIKLDLTATNFDESKEIPLLQDDTNNKIITCYYKRIYETDYGKFIKILMANRLSHPKEKYSFGNEILNHKALFQSEIKVRGENFLPYKQLSETNPFDEELNTINFQYRNENAFAIGHGCAVMWNNNQNPTELKTTFLPEVDINYFDNKFRDDFPEEIKDITELKKLSIWTDLADDEIITKLKSFANAYKIWIDTKQKTQEVGDKFKDIAQSIISKQEDTYTRLLKNIDFLSENETALKSFKLANTAMYIQMLTSQKEYFGKRGIELAELNQNIKYDDLDFFRTCAFNPKYRPFQLAFFLLNIEPIINEKSADRNEVVDLLWFPTGGGKTEAYLALTAFTIISRRILHKENYEGVTVIMRYTLRLLTAQQFERATKVILALDFLRNQFAENDIFYFGNKQILIGMWVGAASTPNSYKDANNVSKKIIDELTRINGGKAGNFEKFNTFPITNCPWCGCNLISKKEKYYMSGYSATTNSFQTKCLNDNCAFHSEELPIYFVDEKIYQNPPTLLFATVDKFAMLSHREEGHKLFKSLNPNKLSPDLIIQDELHLLSGPLGSITGLYESIVELLSMKDGRKPKIIASTATTRNTETQVAMLYGNRRLNIFPSQGITYDDNFFSFASTDSKRKHIGFMPTGKTALNSQLQIIGNLLLARIKLFQYFLKQENLTKEETIQQVNNFWTIVSFYNSLRDVGKVYNKISAEIQTLIRLLHNRYDLNRTTYGFNFYGLSNRTKELTSRVESNKIKNLLSELENPFALIVDKEQNFVQNTVDLVLASNMFSVGIDIERLNVMLMNGQPKNIAEYIQASSRVGRKHKGIVINLLDANRSREKSYFENYVAFHNAYYKYVEPLSVTPFTEISLDKVLASLLICFVRHKKGLYKDGQAKDYKGDISELENFLKERIKNQSQQNYALERLKHLSDNWLEKVAENENLKYKNGLIRKFSEMDEWGLMMSMREIDTNSVIKIQNK